MNTKKIAALALMPAIGVTALAGSVFAANETVTNTNSTKTNLKGKHGPRDNTMFAKDLAAALGMTEADVKAKLDAGTKPDDIITAAGKDKTVIMTAIHATHLLSMKTKLAENVASGKITQAQADEMLTNMANHKQGERGGKMGGPRDGKHTVALAAALNMTEVNLKAALKSGKTIDEITAAQGMTREQVMTKMKTNKTNTTTQ